MGSSKIGGKNFCCVDYYFETYVLCHIPKEQKSFIFFEPSKCTIAFKMLYLVALLTSCMSTKPAGSQIYLSF